MVASNDSNQSDDDMQQFLAEIQLVQSELQTVVATLELPLRPLVQARINAMRPEVRAAVVLAAGIPADSNENADENEAGQAQKLRAQRIYLAAALEMLGAAVSIHKLLLSDEAPALDKAILGGTILAGDYCFSCSATMAVKTGSPEVVKLFSDALKRVSEGNLRQHFSLAQDEDAGVPTSETKARHSAEAFDDNLELFRAGVIAATILVAQPPESAEPGLQFVTRLAGILQTETDPSSDSYVGLQALTHDLPAYQRHRWRHLLTWLSAYETSGTDVTPAIH